MTFANLALDIDALPSARDIDLKPLDPRYRKEVLTQSLLIWGVLLLISFIPSVIVAKPPEVKTRLLLLPVIMTTATVLFTVLAVKMAAAKRMALRDHDIVFRSGLWWRKTVLLPRNRVQHIELSSGPLQRKFGLASLKFYTAGGAAVDLQIDGLSQEHARSLRDHVMQQNL